MRLTCLVFITITALTGCTSNRVQQGGQRGAILGASGIYLAPFFNATPNPNAGRAMSEITSTSLMAHGLPLIQSEDAIRQSQNALEAEDASLPIDMARTLRASHALMGTVHEYRYKSDMDGSPVVGLTMRLVETAGGETVWQGSSTRSSGYFGSLTRTAQGAVDNLMEQMLGRAAPEQPRKQPSVQSNWARSKNTTSAVPPAYGQPGWAPPAQPTGAVSTPTIPKLQSPPSNPYEQIARRSAPSASIPSASIPSASIPNITIPVTTVPATGSVNPYIPPSIPTAQGGGLIPRTGAHYGSTITAPVVSYPVPPPGTLTPPNSYPTSGGVLTPRF